MKALLKLFIFACLTLFSLNTYSLTLDESTHPVLLLYGSSDINGCGGYTFICQDASFVALVKKQAGRHHKVEFNVNGNAVEAKFLREIDNDFSLWQGSYHVTYNPKDLYIRVSYKTEFSTYVDDNYGRGHLFPAEQNGRLKDYVHFYGDLFANVEDVEYRFFESEYSKQVPVSVEGRIFVRPEWQIQSVEMVCAKEGNWDDVVQYKARKRSEILWSIGEYKYLPLEEGYEQNIPSYLECYYTLINSAGQKLYENNYWTNHLLKLEEN